jgi:hypothetical protein
MVVGKNVCSVFFKQNFVFLFVAILKIGFQGFYFILGNKNSKICLNLASLIFV